MATKTLSSLRPWLEDIFSSGGEDIIYGFAAPGDLLPGALRHMPRALSFAVRMKDALMDSVTDGPTAPYYAEYIRVNGVINGISERISERFRQEGFAADWIHSSQRTDFVNIAAAFPHKTAARLAGLGWIGRNCQLVTRVFGPRVRLGTVVTDMELGENPPKVMRFSCGACRRCTDACPAKALTGGTWEEGAERSVLLDAATCDVWKIEHYPEFDASVCGICAAVCPQGTRRKRKKAA